LGYQIKYVPEAIVYNKGPENIRDFLKQRRRIHAGHLALQEKENYQVSTAGLGNILAAFLQNFSFNWRFFVFSPAVAALESWGKVLGWYDHKLKKKKRPIWEIAESTKEL